MRMAQLETAQDTLGDVRDGISSLNYNKTGMDADGNVTDSSVYLPVYEVLKQSDGMAVPLGWYGVTYNEWVYSADEANYNFLYRLYDYESMQEVDFSPYMGNDDYSAIMYVRDADTNELSLYACDDEKLISVLEDKSENDGDENAMYLYNPHIEAVYISGDKFSFVGMNDVSDEGIDYDGPADVSDYTKYDVTMKNEIDDETMSAAFVMNGREYYVQNIVVYRNMENVLGEESAALDFMKSGEWLDEVRQKDNVYGLASNIYEYDGDNLQTELQDLYRAGNVTCGKPYDTDREYAAMAAKVTLANGDTCMLLGVCSYDFKSSAEKLAGNLTKEAAAAALLLGALLTCVIYMPRKIRYDRQEFRRSMTNAMVHDLKTPLMAMSGCAENLAANINTDKREQYARTICENVQKMSGMIDRMLDVDRYEGKRLKAAEQVDMAALAKQVISENMEAIDARGMTATCSGSYTACADTEAMKTVLDNLVTNAVRYGSEDGVIDIEMDESGMTVSNTIDTKPEEELELLWKPYVKGSSAREKSGSGLGLFLVKNILDGYGMKSELDVSDGRFVVRIRG